MSQPESMSAQWILRQLDKSVEDFTFPDLGHGYNYTIDARLHGYADDVRWALIVEVVGYNPRAADVLDILHVYGNCLTHGEPGFVNEDFLGRIQNMDEVCDDDEAWTGGDVMLRDRRVPLIGEPGADLSDVFRSLVPAHRDLLLADEEELRRRIPPDLPEIVTLDAWHQPDLFEVTPSRSQAYCQLAEALSAGDPALYRPTEEPNTHWSNWPGSGSL